MHLQYYQMKEIEYAFLVVGGLGVMTFLPSNQLVCNQIFAIIHFVTHMMA